MSDNCTIDMVMRCTLHNVLYGIRNQPQEFGMRCPICMQVELDQLKALLYKACDQRDALLRAIEIKQTHELLQRYNQP